MFSSFRGILAPQVAIDLGTANTLVFVAGKGIVIREPSAIARHKKTKQILAIGTEARRMEGRTPQTIEAIRPLKDGVIADFDGTAAMLSYFIKYVQETGGAGRWAGLPFIPGPQVVIGIPSGVTEVERRAVRDAVLSVGAREVHLIEEPMAAAIGAGLDVVAPGGIFVVDIGGGTTEIAVVSLGGIVLNKSMRVAGDEFDQAIIAYLRMRYSLLLGVSSAEELKIQIGSATAQKQEKMQVIRGRDLETGLPKSIKISSADVREAMGPVVQQIIARVEDTLEEIPPELMSDLMERGILLAGGGALLPGLDQLISERTKIPVFLADDPLSCVVRGCGKVLTDSKLLSKVRITSGLS